jgi:amino-acid N-acetyltransferase
MKIRTAKVGDVKTIQSMIAAYAEKKEMLPRSLNDIYENIQEYVVAEENKKVIGCCALHVSWDDLAEIKALAIAQNYQHKGIGTLLVKKLHKKALALGINKVFALTFKPKFFLNLKYTQITRESLPHKIWGECVKCPLFPDCGEVPLLLELKKKDR